MLKFKTPVDKNGNTSSVVVNTESKKILWNSAVPGPDYITVSRRDFENLLASLKEDGFRDHIVIGGAKE